MPLSDQRIAGFARELNAALGVVSGHVASARSRLEAEPPDVATARQDLDEIARVCARSAELMRHLLAEMRAGPQ